MSFTDNEFNDKKNKLRIEALEKEVQRLRNSNQRKSCKIGTLRKSLYLQIVFFASLLSVLLFKGLIHFPGHSTALAKADVASPALKPAVSDTLSAIAGGSKDTISAFVYNTHKGALPKANYDGIIFAIQIGAYAGIDLSNYDENLLGIKQDTYDGINQFTLGEFIEYNEAESFLDIVRQMGFNDAFIMSFKNGKRINIQNAIAMRTRKPDLKSTEETPPSQAKSLVVDYGTPKQVSSKNLNTTASINRIQL